MMINYTLSFDDYLGLRRGPDCGTSIFNRCGSTPGSIGDDSHLNRTNPSQYCDLGEVTNLLNESYTKNRLRRSRISTPKQVFIPVE